MFDHELLLQGTGRTLYLTWLHHEWTYGRHYEGPPDARRNQEAVEHGRRLARRIQAAVCGPDDPKPSLLAFIEPFVLPLSSIARATSTAGEDFLPAILCAAKLDSTMGADDPGDYSGLVVVWFQEEVPMPVSDEALVALRDLPWENLARDWFP